MIKIAHGIVPALALPILTGARLERVAGDRHPLLRDITAKDLSRCGGRDALVTRALARPPHVHHVRRPSRPQAM